jgi:hypothetical protein
MRTTSIALIVTLAGMAACTSDSTDSPEDFLFDAGVTSPDAGPGPSIPAIPGVALDGGAGALKDASVATDASTQAASDAGKADAGVGLDAAVGDAGTGDAGGSDASAGDAGEGDAGATDAGSTDGGAGDAGTTDGGVSDAGVSDAGTTDAGTTDAGTTDAGASDAGASDAGTGDAGTGDAGSAGVCGGSTPHGCYKAKAGNPTGCPAQIHEQSASYPPVSEWVACSSPSYVPCVYFRQDGTEANCSCDLGLHWLCSY